MSDNTYRKKIKGLIHSQQSKRAGIQDLHKEYRTIQKIRNTIAMQVMLIKMNTVITLKKLIYI